MQAGLNGGVMNVTDVCAIKQVGKRQPSCWQRETGLKGLCEQIAEPVPVMFCDEPR
jgi:hypothetical protein